MKTQAKFRLGTIVVILSLVAFNRVEATPLAQNVYPDDYIGDYNANCIKRTVAEGLNETDAETLCTCTINQFQSQYTFSEFQQLTEQASSEDVQATEALTQVGESCFEEILFESST